MTTINSEDRALIELKPCPFCGGTPITGRDPTCRNLWRITCRNCDAGPSSSLSEEGARNTWNRRTEGSSGEARQGEGDA